MTKKDNIIEITELSYKKIIHKLTLNIKKGSFVAISGTNCSGKTSLIRLLSNHIESNKSIKYKKEFLEDINKNILYKEIAVLYFDEEITYQYKTVEEELFSILENITLPQKEKITEYQKIIELLSIEEILMESPNTLSYYDKMKMNLASSLLSKPKILLIDDICLSFSKKERRKFLDIIETLNKKKKMTIIITTNNLENTITCDNLYLLDKGKIVLEGSPKDLLKEDNKINKLGLTLPFMYDLSVKLKDYNMITKVELDQEKMVELLWK